VIVWLYESYNRTKLKKIPNFWQDRALSCLNYKKSPDKYYLHPALFMVLHTFMWNIWIQAMNGCTCLLLWALNTYRKVFSSTMFEVMSVYLRKVFFTKERTCQIFRSRTVPGMWMNLCTQQLGVFTSCHKCIGLFTLYLYTYVLNSAKLYTAIT